MPPNRARARHNADPETGTRFLSDRLFRYALPAAMIFFCLTAGGYAQTQQLRGIPDDPRSNLPSVRGMLQRQQDQQIGTFSTRQSIEQSERRQKLDRMNENARDCTSPTGAGCAPPPSK